MGFEFTNFVVPNGEVINSGADFLAGDVFHQSFFVDAQRGFRDSPYVYVMIVLTWGLGSLIVVSEMVKQKVLLISPPAGSDLSTQRRTLAAAAFPEQALIVRIMIVSMNKIISFFILISPERDAVPARNCVPENCLVENISHDGLVAEDDRQR